MDKMKSVDVKIRLQEQQTFDSHSKSISEKRMEGKMPQTEERRVKRIQIRKFSPNREVSEAPESGEWITALL